MKAIFALELLKLCEEKRDLEVAKIKAKFAPKFKTLENKIRSPKSGLKGEIPSQSTKSQHLCFCGATLLGALLGRSSSVGTVGRAATAAKSMSRIGKEKAEVQRAQERLEELQEQLKALQEQFDEALALFTSMLIQCHWICIPVSFDLENRTLLLMPWVFAGSFWEKAVKIPNLGSSPLD